MGGVDNGLVIVVITTLTGLFLKYVYIPYAKKRLVRKDIYVFGSPVSGRSKYITTAIILALYIGLLFYFPTFAPLAGVIILAIVFGIIELVFMAMFLTGVEIDTVNHKVQFLMGFSSPRVIRAEDVIEYSLTQVGGTVEVMYLVGYELYALLESGDKVLYRIRDTEAYELPQIEEIFKRTFLKDPRKSD